MTDKKNTKKAPNLRFKGFTDDWEERKLGKIVEFYSGLTYSPDNIISKGGTFVLRSSNVKNGELINADNVYVDSSFVNSSNVQIGDIVVVVRNGSRNLIGKHAQVKNYMENTVIGAFMTGIRAKEPNYINALLNTQQFKIEINKNLGATINQITTGAFKKMQFSITPNIEEQHEIGSFFDKLDNCITLHQRKLDQLKQLKEALLQQMFPGKGETVPKLRFAGFEGDWEDRKLGDLLHERNQKSVQTEEYPLVSFTVENGVTEKTERYNRNQLVSGDSDAKVYKVTKLNDIVYNPANLKFGAIDRNKYGKAVFSPIYVTFEVIENYIFAEFIEFIVTSQTFIGRALKYQQGTVYERQSVGVDDFLSLNIRIPNLDEQKLIGLFLNDLNKELLLQKDKLDQLKNTKQVLLQNMFI
ncbi:restriction endonuclease subunit S [Aerococcus urinaeequi]|uniref:restriction endonuclease subunit S n=1 Tax=Aerococcus urinaeequi TaxID=51665 RepID=UPI003D6A55C2